MMQTQTRVLTLHQSVAALLTPPEVCSLAADSPPPPRMQMLHNEQLLSQKWICLVLNQKIHQFIMSNQFPDTLVVFSITTKFDQIDSIDNLNFPKLLHSSE